MKEIKTNKVSIKVVKVTKKLVESLLAKNERNRKINKNEVEHILRDIKADNWMFNGDVIKIDKDGYLMDGQHRLTAIKEAGYPSDMELIIIQLPISGEDRDRVFYTMNTSRMSPAGQIFQYNEIPNGTASVAISRWIAKTRFGKNLNLVASHIEIMDTYNTFRKEVDNAVSLSHSKKGVVRFLAPMSAVLAIVAHSRPNSTDVWDFASRVLNGTDLKKDSVEYAFFRYLSSLKTGHIGTMAQREQFFTAANAIYTYLDSPNKIVRTVRTTDAMKERLLARICEDVKAQ